MVKVGTLVKSFQIICAVCKLKLGESGTFLGFTVYKIRMIRNVVTMPRKTLRDAPGALHYIIAGAINRRKIFFMELMRGGKQRRTV
jgi:hypothetical protein